MKTPEEEAIEIVEIWYKDRESLDETLEKLIARRIRELQTTIAIQAVSLDSQRERIESLQETVEKLKEYEFRYKELCK